MNTSAWDRFVKYLYDARQWYRDTPERALEQAYEAALAIKAMEEEHFGGQPVSDRSGGYGHSTLSFFKSELRRYLKVIETRMVEFNASRSFLELPERVAAKSQGGQLTDKYPHESGVNLKDKTSLVFEKLEFIDSVIGKYINGRSTAIVPVETQKNLSINSVNSRPQSHPNTGSANSTIKHPADAVETNTDEVNLLPRSLLGTLSRITKELDPEAEKEVVKNFRRSQVKTVISLRFILLLILIPLLVNQLAKNFVVGPIVDRVRVQNTAPIFINVDLQEEAFKELESFEQQLKFQQLIGMAPPLSSEERKKKIEERAIEIAEEYRDESANAIKIFCRYVLLSCLCLYYRD